MKELKEKEKTLEGGRKTEERKRGRVIKEKDWRKEDKRNRGGKE